MLLGSGEGWLRKKSYLAVLPILIVDHSNTARESGFAIKYMVPCLKV